MGIGNSISVLILSYACCKINWEKEADNAVKRVEEQNISSPKEALLENLLEKGDMDSNLINPEDKS